MVRVYPKKCVYSVLAVMTTVTILVLFRTERLEGPIFPRLSPLDASRNLPPSNLFSITEISETPSVSVSVGSNHSNSAKQSLFQIMKTSPAITNSARRLKREVDDPTLFHSTAFENRLVERFRDLTNLSSEGSNTKPIFTNLATMPYLWGSDPNHNIISREEDRIVAQLVFGMEFGRNLTPFSEQPKKTIYLPDTFHWWYKNKDWKGPHLLNENDCPGVPGIIKNCVFTETLDANSANEVDAIVSRSRYGMKNLPSQPLKFYYLLESPLNTFPTFTGEELLGSFHRSSDLNTPYGKWVYYNPYVRSKAQEKDYAQGKTKMVAVFMSNCYGANNRLGYVRELQKHLQVDVYGACGDLRCSKYTRKCQQMLSQDYYFYLAFENSNCRDYVTEKLFINAFENDVVPVVLGAHPADYKAMCPEKSYIHVENFENPRALAKYLKHLAASPKEYNKYLQWKGTGEFLNTVFFCRLCSMLHYAKIVYPPNERSFKKLIWNPQESFSRGTCLAKGKWYWNKNN